MNNPLTSLGHQAVKASTVFATLSTREKNQALLAIADTLEVAVPEILAANLKDMDAAKESGMTTAMQDRLLLTEERILSMAEAVRAVAELPDPVGKVLEGSNRPNGLEIVKKTVPLGVVALIYEARPNVTIDCAVLCLKAGNACILRGGSEAIHSNIALANVIQQALISVGLPPESVQLIEDTDRATATHLMTLSHAVDVLIPRGGQGLIQSVVKNATVPVIETGAGTCHIYVDDSAQIDMAVSIVDNTKTSRPSVCNAVETLLVHRDIAPELLPAVAKTLTLHNVELRGCPRTRTIWPGAAPATPEDWAAEYGDFILAIKVVDSLEEAIEHIAQYSTKHSDAIVTERLESAREFTKRVDSAAVYVNASTRFTDGGEFGLGAEIGISTQKLHVRGPMGLDALTSSKYIITGNGQIRG